MTINLLGRCNAFKWPICTCSPYWPAICANNTLIPSLSPLTSSIRRIMRVKLGTLIDIYWLSTELHKDTTLMLHQEIFWYFITFKRLVISLFIFKRLLSRVYHQAPTRCKTGVHVSQLALDLMTLVFNLDSDTLRCKRMQEIFLTSKSVSMKKALQ